MLTIEPTSVPVGGSITVHGRYYVNGCADVIENGGPAETVSPMIDVPLMTSVTS